MPLHLRLTAGSGRRRVSTIPGERQFLALPGRGASGAAAAAGAEWVVHAASDTRRLGRSDLEQTRHLLDATAGARHLLYVSIVGIDVIPFGYYKAELACEREISAGRAPSTILRATQFHELLARVWDLLSSGAELVRAGV